MPEDSAESSKSPEQPNKKLINLLGRIAITLAVLMIGFVLSTFGFLLYGLITAKLGQSIVGVVVSIICFSLLFGLFRLVIKAAHLQAPGQKDQLTTEMATGNQTTYAKVKDELSTRYGHPRIGKD